MKAGEGARGPSSSLDRRTLARLKQRLSLNSILSLRTMTAWHLMKAGEGARGPSNSLDRLRLPPLHGCGCIQYLTSLS